MSENKNHGKKDSFAKPGDESIVSGGKSFFLSFAKPKKGPSNPLIESERNKAEKTAEGSRDGKKGGNANNNGNNNNNNNNGKGNQNGNKGKNPANAHKGEGRAAETQSPEDSARHGDRRQNEGQGKKQKPGKHRPDRNRPPKQETPASEVAAPERAEAKREDAPREGKGHHDKRNDRFDRRNEGKGQRPEKTATPENAESQKKQDANQQRHDKKSKGESRGEARPEQRNEQRNENRNDRGGRNDRRGKGQSPSRSPKEEAPIEAAAPERTAAPRPKHKKEKFVPTASGQPLTDDSLLQPIVNRSGIISGGTSGAFKTPSRSRFGVGAFTGETDNSVSYFDKSRPLSEQIAERSRPVQYKRDEQKSEETVEVIGVRFREAGKVYYFDPGKCRVEKDEAVIVETARGVEYGFCAIANRNVSTNEIVAPLKPILRKATAEDTESYNGNKELEESAARIFKEKVAMLNLEMSLVYVEYTFDKGKLLFYFTADGRVDFRELIKELASAFRTRIELRQIGVRDEAKIVGGLGICGRPVCCKSFLGEFSQVSIKMAKDQNLFLNSSKISGTCGRFMCCIRYEDEVYQKEYEKTPKVDAIVETPEGKGVVVESNALKGMVKVLLDDQPESVPQPFKSADVKVLGYIKRENDIPDDIEIPEE